MPMWLTLGPQWLHLCALQRSKPSLRLNWCLSNVEMPLLRSSGKVMRNGWDWVQILWHAHLVPLRQVMIDHLTPSNLLHVPYISVFITFIVIIIIFLLLLYGTCCLYCNRPYASYIANYLFMAAVSLPRVWCTATEYKRS